MSRVRVNRDITAVLYPKFMGAPWTDAPRLENVQAQSPLGVGTKVYLVYSAVQYCTKLRRDVYSTVVTATSMLSPSRMTMYSRALQQTGST